MSTELVGIFVYLTTDDIETIRNLCAAGHLLVEGIGGNPEKSKFLNAGVKLLANLDKLLAGKRRKK